MDVLLEDDDDVGPAVAEKLQILPIRLFQSNMLLKVSKKEVHKRPKNSDKVTVPRVKDDETRFH